MMSGRIWVESRVNEGSTFHVEIPLLTAEGSHRPDYLNGAIPGKKSALLVTDHDSNRLVYQEQLQLLGINVHCISHPDLSPDDKFDVIVGDILATNDSPSESIRMLRELAAINTCDLIALTPADGTASQLQQANEHVVLKPASMPSLISTLQEALSVNDNPSEGDDTSTETLALAPTGRALRILLADDSLVNQEVGKGLLEVNGHIVTCVDNGLLAIDAISEQDFDLVLMDLEMPEMDGIEATERIRSDEQARGDSQKLPIIAMTAHGEGSVGDRFTRDLIDGYLTKPILPALLYDALDQVCGLTESVESTA
jgi:CheY-like chemotaxis protein